MEKSLLQQGLVSVQQGVVWIGTAKGARGKEIFFVFPKIETILNLHSEFSFWAVAGSRTSEFGLLLFNFYMYFQV